MAKEGDPFEIALIRMENETDAVRLQAARAADFSDLRAVLEKALACQSETLALLREHLTSGAPG